MKKNQFEAALIELHMVKESELTVFRSRLRILRDDARAPFVSRPGKGTRIDYTLADVFVTHLALALDAAGYPPLVIGEIMDNLRTFRQAEQVIAHSRKKAANDLWLKLEILSYAFGGERHLVSSGMQPLFIHINYLKSMDATSRLPDPGPHTLAPQLLNASRLLRDCEAVVANYK